MTEEIMPKENRVGKILTFIGGCLTGVLGVFAVAVMSELSCPTPNVGRPTFTSSQLQE